MTRRPHPAPARRELRRVLRFLRRELRPKGKVLTPFNVITAMLMLATLVLLVIRFAYGLGAITNLNQDMPWGLWIGFDVMTGVAFAGGAYVLTFIVYILGVEKYRPIIRVVVLNGFLAYVFYAGALMLDLGRPWKVINPIIGNSFGFNSVLFLVAWHFLLYMIAELVEFSPAVAEWLGLERMRRILSAATVGAVIFGITLSTLHQAGLGALYLMAKPKVHPLWYSEFIPILFLVSSVFAGLSMVILEGSVSQKVFAHRLDANPRRTHHSVMAGLSRICAGTMFAYLFLLLIAFVHDQDWHSLRGGFGALYLVEVLGLTAVPMGLFVYALRRRRFGLIRIAACLSLLGIVLNRLCVSVIAFKWYETSRYVPSWMEVVVTLGVISAELWVFRWVVNRMPVLGTTGNDEQRIKGRIPPQRTAAEAAAEAAAVR